MRHLLPILLSILVLIAGAGNAADAGELTGQAKNCRSHDGKMDCETGPAWCKSSEGTCSPEMRGRCGKRRGDWYGARQPVTSPQEARKLLQNYFADQSYTVSETIEKKWGFKAEILDKNGVIIDKVLIDKRSGRIRSIY